MQYWFFFILVDIAFLLLCVKHITFMNWQVALMHLNIKIEHKCLSNWSFGRILMHVQSYTFSEITLLVTFSTVQLAYYFAAVCVIRLLNHDHMWSSSRAAICFVRIQYHSAAYLSTVQIYTLLCDYLYDIRFSVTFKQNL